MNRILCHTFLLFFCLTSLCFASNKTIIYGFERAEDFSGKSDHPFYIRAGSFTKKSNAISYRKFLQTKTTYPVMISQKAGWAVVSVGPIRSVSELKKTAKAFRKLTRKVTVEHHYPENKSIPPKQRNMSSKTVPPIVNVKAYQPIVTLTVGPDFVQGGKAQLVTLLPPFQNFYTLNSDRETVADAGIFLGVEHALTGKLTAQLGIAGYVDSKLTPQGHVWEFAEPEFDNLSYLYHIQHSRVMLAGKLLSSFTNYQSIHPYFSWEVGAAFNQASGYQETSFTPEVLPMEPFANKTQSSFAYGVGFGVDYNLTRHIRLGAGYQFANLGSASLGVSPASATIETLSLSHLYTNQLRLQLTYII